MTIATSPIKRSCPSESSVRRRKASRQVRGAISGSRPSITNTRAHAASRLSGTACSPVWRLLVRAALRSPPAAGLLQILEEIGTRIEHHDVALVLERRLVRLQAAVERVELGVLPVRAGINRGSLGVALALGLLRLLVGVGENDLALAIGVGADLLRLGAALRPQLVGDALALGLHALVDLREHFVRQLDAAQAHVDDFDADRSRVSVGFLT